MKLVQTDSSIRCVLRLACLLAGILAAPSPVEAQGFVLGDSFITIVDGTSAGGGFSATATVDLLDPIVSTGGGFSGGASVTPGILDFSGLAPLLSVVVSAGQVSVSWPLPADGFVLEEASSLSPPVSWSPTSLQYATNATHITVTVPAPSGAEFFHLKKP